MSTEAVSAFVAHSRSYGSTRLVGTVLAHHIGSDPREGCYPSQALLSAETGFSERHIRRCIQELVDLGEFEVWQADGDSRTSRKPNRYYIKIECPETCDTTAAHRKLPGWKLMQPVDNFSKGANMGDI